MIHDSITREKAIELGMLQCPDCERWNRPGLHYCTARLEFVMITRKQPSDEDIRAELAAAKAELEVLRAAIREYRVAQRAYGEMIGEDSYPSNFADAQTRVRQMRNRLYAAVEAGDAH